MRRNTSSLPPSPTSTCLYLMSPFGKSLHIHRRAVGYNHWLTTENDLCENKYEVILFTILLYPAVIWKANPLHGLDIKKWPSSPWMIRCPPCRSVRQHQREFRPRCSSLGPWWTETEVRGPDELRFNTVPLPRPSALLTFDSGKKERASMRVRVGSYDSTQAGGHTIRPSRTLPNECVCRKEIV